jgi:Holliday junction resolvase RusA-like endonuclease
MYKEAKQWKKDAVWLFLAHKGEEPTKITITYYLKFNRDVDGSHKLILDAMQDRGGGAGVMKDDNSITDLILHKEKDKDHPRVEIEW